MSADHCQGLGGTIRTPESDTLSPYAHRGHRDVLLYTAIFDVMANGDRETTASTSVHSGWRHQAVSLIEDRQRGRGGDSGCAVENNCEGDQIRLRRSVGQ
jgi:hypothetical protein